MADVLLAHCNHLHFDRKQTRKMQPYPPLQTLISAACLRQEGYDVALFDSTLEYSDDAFRAALDQHRPRMVALCEDNFNFLTKMCLTRNRELAFFMTQAAKEIGVPVVANSSDASDHITDYLCHGLNFVIVGEVERTMLEVARRLLGDSDAPFESIPGLAFREPDTGRLQINPRASSIAISNSLPLPAWDLIDAEAYRRSLGIGATAIFP